MQQCFGLSDKGIEDALYDSQAIRRFMGIDLNRESPPDATTLLNFWRLLEAISAAEVDSFHEAFWRCFGAASLVRFFLDAKRFRDVLVAVKNTPNLDAC